MARARKTLICSLGAILAMAVLWGCNGTNVDDPENSDSLLIVDNVTPASVQADVSPDTDPNSMLTTPPKDDLVEVLVRNVNRTQSDVGFFGDILVTSFDVSCENATLDSTNNPSSLTIPAETTASITVLLAPGPFKEANAAALLMVGTDRCAITFNGEDLSGEPVLSREAIVGISYVDTP